MQLPAVTAARDYSDIIFIHGGEEQDTLRRFLLRTAFECRFCYEGIVSLHAACVDLGDHAVAFTGRSGLGKSTRAGAWAEALGAQWISGDRPAIRLQGQESIACGVPWDGKEQIYRSVERPLRCILEVRRSSANYVRRLSEEQARQLIMKQSFVPMWDTEAAVMAMANVRRLIRQTPVYRVFCGPDPEDAAAIHDTLVNHPERILEAAEDIRLKKSLVLASEQGQCALMPVSSRAAASRGAVVLNEVAAFIYCQLKEPVSFEDLLRAVTDEYEVDEATAARDLKVLLADLAEKGILAR